MMLMLLMVSQPLRITCGVPEPGGRKERSRRDSRGSPRSHPGARRIPSPRPTGKLGAGGGGGRLEHSQLPKPGGKSCPGRRDNPAALTDPNPNSHRWRGGKAPAPLGWIPEPWGTPARYRGTSHWELFSRTLGRRELAGIRLRIPALPYPSCFPGSQHFLTPAHPYPSASLHPSCPTPGLSHHRLVPGADGVSGKRGRSRNNPREGAETGRTRSFAVAPTGTPGSLRSRGDSRPLRFSSATATTNSRGEEGAKLELRRSADGALRAPGRTESPGIAGGGISPPRARFPFGKHLGIGCEWVLKERRREREEWGGSGIGKGMGTK